MSEAREAVVKLVAIALSLAVLRMLQRRQLPEPLRRRVLWGLAGLGALAYVNFGGFHTDGTVLHVWDQFHYAIGSKYFPELGYDGLYAATLAARGESHPELPPPARIRDLRDYRIVPSSELAPVAREVRARFSAPRWAAFVEDTARVSARDELFLDHGYLPTPAHVAIERVFSTPLAFRTRSLWLWALLDFGLLALAGLVVYRTLGLEALTASALVFGLGYCSRYYWIGGAFLRQDWLVALLLAAAALRRERWGWAGLALGYAAWVRVFPALFVVPLAVHAWRDFEAHRSNSGLASCSPRSASATVCSRVAPCSWPVRAPGVVRVPGSNARLASRYTRARCCRTPLGCACHSARAGPTCAATSSTRPRSTITRAWRKIFDASGKPTYRCC